MKPLSNRHRAFITAYMVDLDPVTSYKEVYKVGHSTAKTNGNKLLSHTAIKAEIDARLEKQSVSSARTKPFIMDKMAYLSQKAEGKGQYQTSLNCYKEIATLMGHYGQEQGADGYVKLIQVLTQNIQINTGGTNRGNSDDGDEEVIDIP